MVFCLCTGRRCFSRTLVINSSTSSNKKGAILEDKTIRRQSYHQTHHLGYTRETGRSVTIEQPPDVTIETPTTHQSYKVQNGGINGRTAEDPVKTDQGSTTILNIGTSQRQQIPVETLQNPPPITRHDEVQDPKDDTSTEQPVPPFEKTELIPNVRGKGQEVDTFIEQPVIPLQETKTTTKVNGESRQKLEELNLNIGISDASHTVDITHTEGKSKASTKKERAPMVPTLREPSSPNNTLQQQLEQNDINADIGEASSSIDVNWTTKERAPMVPTLREPSSPNNTLQQRLEQNDVNADIGEASSSIDVNWTTKERAPMVPTLREPSSPNNTLQQQLKQNDVNTDIGEASSSIDVNWTTKERAPMVPTLREPSSPNNTLQQQLEQNDVNADIGEASSSIDVNWTTKERAPMVPTLREPSSSNNTLQQQLEQHDVEADIDEASSSIDINSPKQSIDLDTPKLSIDLDHVSRERREGVAPIPVKIDENMNERLPVYIKDPSDEELIRKAIQKNDFLDQVISGNKLKDVIAAMYNKEISAKETIIKQGDKGQHMYISAKGTYKIAINGKTVSEFKDVRVFGELAILYNAKRLATIKAVTSGRVWVLDSNVYQQITIRENIKAEDERQDFLLNNDILNVVGKDALHVVSTLLKSEFFTSGQTIVRQGDRGDKFYIIRAGTVTISKDGEGIVGVYKKGDCFGELALLEEDSRQATVTANAPGVECLSLTRKEFIDHLGEIKNFKYIKVKDKPKDSIRSLQTDEFEDIHLGDLRIIKTLGVGGFGRVELVQHTKDENLVFALKYLKKIEIVQQNQQEHVFNEKTIQMNCRSPFIARLYRTYKDTKYIYFLMESCLGGDLWSLLQKQKNRRFEEKEARFICACVLLAFEYLHSRGIVYRDLKPENLLIASSGSIKLTDFGFAKKITTRGKTYTFAGTPEYVAPEIVLNRGHDRAVDYWAFGAFIFEMLSGRTPFRTDDSSHMRTYNKILSGIDNIQFPTYINLKARHLVEKLCRPVPSERLGMQRNGIVDIKNHKWFLGLDWQKFSKLDVPSPFKPKLTGPVDTRYFDHFKRDTDKPPEELSGWDEKF